MQMMLITHIPFSKLSKMIAVGLLSIAVSSFASEIACRGTSTTIYSDENTTLTICHGQDLNIDTAHAEQWQECIDAIVYTEDKRQGKSNEYTDCLPTEEKQIRLDHDKFMVRHFYTTYPGFEFEPLMVETLDLKTNVKTYHFEKHFPECKKTDIDEAVKLIDETVAKPFDGKTFFSAIYSSFYKLRDCAQSDPNRVISILKTYKKKSIFDGEVSETLSSVIDEVELMKGAEQQNMPLPLKDGDYLFEHKYAEAEQHNIKSIQLLVKIRGKHITVINNDRTDVFPNGVIEEGTLMWHAKSRQWIIGNSPADKDADEVGGCSDGPTVIDLVNRLYWTC